MSENLWSALRSTVLAVMDGWAFTDREPWSAEEQSRFADEMAHTIEQEHAASLVPDNGAEIRQWQREYDALHGYCLLCCESGYAHEPGCPNDPSPLRPDDIHGLCPGGPIPEGATCPVCNMSWQTHRRLVNTLELAPAAVQPDGRLREVIERLSAVADGYDCICARVPDLECAHCAARDAVTRLVYVAAPERTVQPTQNGEPQCPKCVQALADDNHWGKPWPCEEHR